MGAQHQAFQRARPQRDCQHGMPGFVDSRWPRLHRVKIVAANLGMQVRHRQIALAITGAPPGTADDALDVGAAGPQDPAGRGGQVLVGQVAPEMLAQDMHQCVMIRAADADVPVQPSGPDERRVETLRRVAGANDDDALTVRSAIQFGQQGIDDLGVPLRVMRHCRTVRDRIDLVDEQNAGRLRPRVGKCPSHGA